MTFQAIKDSLSIPGLVPFQKNLNEDGSINEEWVSGFDVPSKTILSAHIDVFAKIKTSKNLHLVDKGEVLVKDIPYRRFIVAEHKDIDPARVMGDF